MPRPLKVGRCRNSKLFRRARKSCLRFNRNGMPWIDGSKMNTIPFWRAVSEKMKERTA
jgi:hypothetical protein